MHPRPRSHRRAIGLVGAAVAVSSALAGCGDDEVGDAERFCGEVQANADAIVDPPLEHPEDVDAALDLYRDVGAAAPLDIEPHWDALVLNLETASTVDPDDPESLQRVYARAYATEREARTVRDWLRDHCEVDLGPVATIVPPAAKAPPTTAVGG